MRETDIFSDIQECAMSTPHSSTATARFRAKHGLTQRDTVIEAMMYAIIDHERRIQRLERDLRRRQRK